MAKDGKRVDQVLDIIKDMTMLELRDLNKRIQDDFGITAAAPVAVAAPVAAGAAAPAAEAAAEEEKAEWTGAVRGRPSAAPAAAGRTVAITATSSARTAWIRSAPHHPALYFAPRCWRCWRGACLRSGFSS